MELVKKIFDYFLITIILISTNSIYVNSGYRLIPYIIVIVGISIFIKLVTTKLPIKSFKKIFLIVGIYYLVILLLTLVHFEFIQNLYYFFIFPSTIFLVLIESYANSLYKFINKFVQVIIIMAYVSLFFWCFGSILNVISPTNYVLNGWVNGSVTSSYFNLYFETQGINFLGIHFIRNSGIYAEGPMWNLMLSLALMVQVLLLSKNTKREIILLLTIFTVASTTGIFIIGFLYIYKSIRYLKGWQRVITFSTVPIIVYGLMQVIDDKSNSISASIRLDDFFAGISAWKESPFLGSGFYNGLKVFESYMNTGIRSNLGNSDSFVLILAQGGILLGILYFYPMFKILFSNKYTINLKIFTILYFIILITSIFVDTPLFALFQRIVS